MKETQKHKDAFLYWYKSLNEGKLPTDSILAVTEKFGISDRTAWRWHKDLHWNEKRAIKDAEINKGVEEKLMTSIMENKIMYLGLVHAPINVLIDQINKGEIPIKIENANDLDRLIKLGLLLQDQPTDKVDNTHDITTNVEKVDDLFKIAEEGNEDPDIDDN